jgi:hypothetical protein
MKDSKLRLSFGPDDDYELGPVSSTRFRLATFPVSVEFAKKAEAGTYSLSIQGDGDSEKQSYEGAAEFKPNAEELAAFAGVYRSAEIEPVYRIVLEKGELSLRRLKHKPAKLEPQITDYFSSPTGSIHFVRDSRGNVTGFVLNAGRLRGMRFSKGV